MVVNGSTLIQVPRVTALREDDCTDNTLRRQGTKLRIAGEMDYSDQCPDLETGPYLLNTEEVPFGRRHHFRSV